MAVYLCPECKREFNYIHDYQRHIMLTAPSLADRLNSLQPSHNYEARLKETGDARKQEIKMTRQEAIKKIDEHRGVSANSNEWLVKALEALGLIKFESEKLKDKMLANVIGYKFHLLRTVPDCDDSLTDIGLKIIREIELAGYKIIKEQS